MTEKDQQNHLLVKPRIAIIIASLLFLLIVVILTTNKGSYGDVVFSDFLSPILNVVAALLLFRAGRFSQRVSKKIAKAWYFFAAALMSYAVGDLIWADRKSVV